MKMWIKIDTEKPLWEQIKKQLPKEYIKNNEQRKKME